MHETVCNRPTMFLWRESSAMENDLVRIESLYSPNPVKQENYIFICDSHRVRTIVTSKPVVVSKWVYSIRHRHRYQLRRGRLVVGLGVQWAPRRGAPAATLQLCVGHSCLIFQLLFAGRSPAVLRRFLAEPGVIFVGVRNYRDAAMLLDSRHGLRIRRLVDLRDVASDLRGCNRSASMETLAAVILGMHGMKKKAWVGRSDWDDAWLSEEQVEYACQDAFLSFLIAKDLRVWKWSGKDD